VTVDDADTCQTTFMSRSNVPTNRHIECLRFLRCVAATLVVIYHTDLQLWRLSDGAHVQSAGFGAAGTDLLFVISGFTMVYISHGKSLRFGEFIFRRIARIAPLYWLLTLCMLAAFVAWPNFFNNTTFDLEHFLASLAFVPSAHPVLGIQRPFLVPGWALNIIAFFYLLFGLFLFLPSRQRIVAVGLALCILAALRWWFFGASPLLDFYGAPVVLDFVLGMLVAWIYLERRSVPIATITVVLAASAAVFAAGVLLGIGGGDQRVLYWGLADTGILFSILFIEKDWGWWNPSIVAQLGDASFATYLSNLFSLALVAKAVQITGLFPLLGEAGTQILLVTSALIVGVLTSILLERPLHSFVLRNGGRLLDVARSSAQAGTSIWGLVAGRQTAPGSGSKYSPAIGAATGVPLLQPVPGDREAG
jgi:exopolysaccharide production protein ExoZ